MRAKLAGLEVYFEKRILAILILGIVSGLPLSLTLSTLTIWLAENGVEKAAIGLFALIGTPYTIKFLWSPLVDKMPLPFFTKTFGKRRGWLIFSEILLAIFIVLLGASNPMENLWAMAFFGLMVSIFSATQDIVIDAYRVEILDDSNQGAGAAAIVFGYRIGMLISSAGALFLAHYAGWFVTYSIMAAIIMLGAVTVMLTGEPSHASESKSKNLTDWFRLAVFEPFREFTSRNGWVWVLLFIILYKLGDAFAGVMTGPFVIDLGFDKTDYAKIVKLYGFVALMVGSFIGGSMIFKLGLLKSLWVAGILQMLSNLMFVGQAYVGQSEGFLIATIMIENLAGGLGTTIFVAYISKLCNRQYTATQYALFSSLAATGRTWLSASSGYVVDATNWMTFFAISTVIAIPGLLLLLYVGKFIDDNKK